MNKLNNIVKTSTLTTLPTLWGGGGGKTSQSQSVLILAPTTKTLEKSHLKPKSNHYQYFNHSTKNKLTFTVYLTLFVLLSFLFISCGVTNSTNNSDSGSDGDNGNNGIENSPLGTIIVSGTITNDVSTSTNMLVANTIGRVGGTTGASINAVYVTESGSGNYSGSNWNNAHRGTNLRTVIDGINDASTSKVYVVLIGAGTYKATTGTNRTISFSMKNHTAIIGGFDATAGVGSWTRSGSVTAFDGDIGTAGDNSDNTRKIFVHDTASGIDHTAVLYGAEIRNGNGNGSGNGSGAGMENNGANPTIVGVTFINNTANVSGGGMYNLNSSPLIINSSFIGNEGTGTGGGGIANFSSSPIVVNTTFVSNSSSISGGAIVNENSSITLVNVTTFGNSARVGGGIYNANTVTTRRESVVVNSIAWSNIVGGNPGQIHLGNNLVNVNLTLAGTVLQGDTNAITIDNTGNPFNIINDGVISNDANVGSLTTSGNRYMSILTGSSAINIGYHVKIDGTFANDGTATGATLYYSQNGNDWFTRITSSGLADSMTPPSTAVYLTKYDVTGQERTGRPDAGAYEAR